MFIQTANMASEQSSTEYPFVTFPAGDLSSPCVVCGIQPREDVPGSAVSACFLYELAHIEQFHMYSSRSVVVMVCFKCAH